MIDTIETNIIRLAMICMDEGFRNDQKDEKGDLVLSHKDKKATNSKKSIINYYIAKILLLN